MWKSSGVEIYAHVVLLLVALIVGLMDVRGSLLLFQIEKSTHFAGSSAMGCASLFHLLLLPFLISSVGLHAFGDIGKTKNFMNLVGGGRWACIIKNELLDSHIHRHAWFSLFIIKKLIEMKLQSNKIGMISEKNLDS